MSGSAVAAAAESAEAPPGITADKPKSLADNRYAQYRSTTFFGALDGLRACAVLLVVLYHTDTQFFAGRLWSWCNGQLGVPIFFVISGFLITTLCLREEDSRGKLDLRGFYLRRSFRIFPAYFAVVTFYCLLVFVLGFEEHRAPLKAALPYLLTYLNEFSPSGTLSQTWSLGIEEKFYLVWPFLAFVLLRGRDRQRWVLAAVFVIVPAAVCTLAPVKPTVAIGYAEIMAGCMLALALHNRNSFPALYRLGSWWKSAAVAALLLQVTFEVSGRYLPLYLPLLGYCASIALVLAALVTGQTPLAGLLESAPLAFVGRRSYGIYLVHLLALKGGRHFVPRLSSQTLEGVLVFLGAVAISLICADVLYRVLERPCISYGRRLAARRLS